MANNLSSQLIAQLFGQQSNDPFLTLLTLTHSSFAGPIYLVNNSVDIVSRGNTFMAFPMKIKLPVDDGESNRDVAIEFDNVSLELINELRTVTTAIDVKLEMVLASIPDDVQIALEELKIGSVSYNKTRVSAKLYMDNFLNTEMTSERYDQKSFPGLF